MPSSRSRRGLTENAAGQLACPVCHDARAKLVFVAYGSPQASITASVSQAKITYSIEGEGSQQFLTVLYQCVRGHEYALELNHAQDDEDVTMGLTAVVTRWEDETP